MTRYLFIALLAVLTMNTGCNLIYKQNVQQGNALKQEDLDQVQLGMSKKQVAYLLGTPSIHDPFHQDRWDYISLFSRRGNDPVRRLVTLTFKDDALIATNGIGNSETDDVRSPDESEAVGADSEAHTSAGAIVSVSDGATTDWTLQLGAFNTHEAAVEFVDRATQAGYTATLREYVVPGLGTRYQVRSGLFDTLEEARAALQRAEKDLDIAAITVPVDTTVNEEADGA